MIEGPRDSLPLLRVADAYGRPGKNAKCANLRAWGSSSRLMRAKGGRMGLPWSPSAPLATQPNVSSGAESNGFVAHPPSCELRVLPRVFLAKEGSRSPCRFTDARSLFAVSNHLKVSSPAQSRDRGVTNREGVRWLRRLHAAIVRRQSGRSRSLDKLEMPRLMCWQEWNRLGASPENEIPRSSERHPGEVDTLVFGGRGTRPFDFAQDDTREWTAPRTAAVGNEVPRLQSG